MKKNGKGKDLTPRSPAQVKGGARGLPQDNITLLRAPKSRRSR